jgi:hypothetical protein
MAHYTINLGTHSELIASAALLAAGYEVSKPIQPESYDLSTRDPETGETKYYQVKTARVREERDGYIVINARKGKDGIYPKDEVDYIVGVHGEDVYILENREIKEYWVSPHTIDQKWTKLRGDIREVKQ